MNNISSGTRFFNKIEFSGNTVKKIIYDKNRGKEEVFFYKTLEYEEKQFFPEIKKISRHKDSISYEMEFIPYLDVSQLYLSQRLHPAKIKNLLNSIDIFWSQTKKQTVSRKVWKKVAEDVIIHRMSRRWSIYQKLPVYKKMQTLFKKKKKIDINILKNQIQHELQINLAGDTETQLYRTHGDLCFSNMFLVGHRSIKLIDPRGGLKKQDLYIPLIYDMAKLSQCIYGNYDGIIGNKKIDFKKQRGLFSRWLDEKKVNQKSLRLVEASHFISLLPLHADHPMKHYDFLNAALCAYKESLCHK